MRRALIPAVAGLVALVTSAALYVHYHDRYRTPTNIGIVPPPIETTTSSTRSTQPSSSHHSSHPTPSRSKHTNPPKPKVPPAVPVRVHIKDLQVDSEVIPVGVSEGSLVVPEDPQTLGWWKDGAKPGSKIGSVVIDGHVDSAQLGLGALFHLDTLKLGALVSINTTKGTITYRVVGRQVFQKKTLPGSIFSQQSVPRLVIVTCGGPFDSDTGSYLDNVVVYAVPVT